MLISHTYHLCITGDEMS